MKYSSLFPKTTRSAPSGTELDSTNFLYRGGYIDQLMAGVFTILPLGMLVQHKIIQIIREEMNAVGGQEILMPVLQPKEIWDETGRWKDLKGDMYQLKDNSGREVGLAFTQEETLLDLIRKHSSSYKDYPISLYHFSTKFRDEPRPKAGLLRVREFIMKDLYSAHIDKEDFDKYYKVMEQAYSKTFKRLGLETKVVEASGGAFTKNHSHEFQVLSEAGEDTIFYCQKCDFAQNKEIAAVAEGDKCPKCGGLIATSKAIEVGNIFPFGTYYSEKMNVKYTDKSGKEQHPYFGSYGIGIGRALATLAEVYRDNRGLAWPEQVAPFMVHLVSLGIDNMKVRETAQSLEEKLTKAGVEVLYDNRDEPPGVKLTDADLIGIPWRIVISPKSLGAGGVELKARDSDQSKVMTETQIIKKLS